MTFEETIEVKAKLRNVLTKSTLIQFNFCFMFYTNCYILLWLLRKYVYYKMNSIWPNEKNVNS